MASVNRVTLIGNLGADPEIRYMQNGDAVCNITLATSESWKAKDTGEKKERTEWHRVVFYRKLAEIAGQYLKKGASIYVEGPLRNRKWQDKEGNDRYTTEVEAIEMKMLGGRAEGGDRKPSGDEGHQPAPQRNAQGAQRDSFDGMEDDIPFNRYGHGKAWAVI